MPFCLCDGAFRSPRTTTTKDGKRTHGTTSLPDVLFRVPCLHFCVFLIVLKRLLSCGYFCSVSVALPLQRRRSHRPFIQSVTSSVGYFPFFALTHSQSERERERERVVSHKKKACVNITPVPEQSKIKPENINKKITSGRRREASADMVFPKCRSCRGSKSSDAERRLGGREKKKYAREEERERK